MADFEQEEVCHQILSGIDTLSREATRPILFCLSAKGSTQKGKNLLPKGAVEPFLEGDWCAGKQRGYHKRYITFKQWQKIHQMYQYSLLASVAQLEARPTSDQEVLGSTPPGWQHFCVELDNEIFSMVIFSIPLIQEGQLSVSGERMCTILVYCLED